MKILNLLSKKRETLLNCKGMELVQVAIIIGIALLIGFIFREKIFSFVNEIFDGLKGSKFTT